MIHKNAVLCQPRIRLSAFLADRNRFKTGFSIGNLELQIRSGNTSKRETAFKNYGPQTKKNSAPKRKGGTVQHLKGGINRPKSKVVKK